MKQPEITCLIPSFNTKQAALFEAVHCILNQTYQAKKIIVIDDASNDRSTIDALEMINHHPDVQVVFREANGGTSDALNYGHKMVSTEYVAVMGSDDVCSIERFRKQADFLAHHPNISVLGTQLFSFLDSDITRRSNWKSNHALYPKTITGAAGTTGFIVNHGTVIYKQDAVIASGGYNIACKRGQDVDLWKRMWAKGYKFANLPEVLYGWRRYK